MKLGNEIINSRSEKSGPTPRAADGGSLRDLQAFSMPRQFSGLESAFSPAAANANRWAVPCKKLNWENMK